MKLATGISSNAIAKLLGLSTRQLHHWDAHGVISPSAEPATGSGSRRRYLPDDLLWLLVVKELRSQSVGLGNIGGILRAIRHAGVGLDCHPETRLVWAKGRILSLDSDAARSARAVSSETTSLVIHIGRLAGAAKSRLSEYRPATVHSLDIEGRNYRVVLTTDDRGVTARCIGRPGVSTTGGSATAALEQLSAELHRLAAAKRTVRRASGAAAWGESW